MNVQIKTAQTYVDTGGRDFDASLPSIILVHGVLNDHRVWSALRSNLPLRAWNIIAPDMAGHGQSYGEAPQSVREAAEFIIALLDSLAIQKAVLIGHSFGSLAVLEAAGLYPHRVSHLVLAGTAYPMQVSSTLLDLAQHDPQKAIELVSEYSHSNLTHLADAEKAAMRQQSRELMQSVLASNTKINLFARGFHACNNYENAEHAITNVTRANLPILFLFGENDRMTRPAKAQTLTALAPHAHMTTVSAGHALMAEAPDAVCAAVLAFLQAHPSN